MLVVAYRRSYDAIKDVGRNVTVVWKPDSTALAVTVSELYIFAPKVKYWQVETFYLWFTHTTVKTYRKSKNIFFGF